MCVYVGSVITRRWSAVDVQIGLFGYVVISCCSCIFAEWLGKRLKAISVLGMGILVGAALTIIIPEYAARVCCENQTDSRGVSTLYSSLPNGRDNQEGTVKAIGLSLLSGFALMLM